MFLTLAQAKAYSLNAISGSCNNSPAFLQLLNEGIQDLMRRGDIAGTVIPIHVCASRGCVVFNRYVGQVRRINLCRYPTPIKNFWTDYLNPSDTMWQSNCGSSCRITAGGWTPVFQDIMGEDRLVRAFPSVQADVGKTVTIFGTDNNGQPLMHRESDGLWYDGWPITLAIPYGVTTDGAHAGPLPVRHIDRIVLGDMNGIVRLYAFNTVTSLLEALGEYMPGETVPSYQRYNIGAGSCCGPLTGCGGTFTVLALVKLRFIPVARDTDLVLVNNLSALKKYMQSVKFGEAGDDVNATKYELKAIRELNLQLKDEFPDDQMPVELGEVPAGIGYQRVF